MDRTKALHRYPFTRVAGMAMLLAILLAYGGLPGLQTSHTALAATKTALSGGGSCDLQSVGNNIHHVIYIQFDNTHLTRDNPNVPSDLEQMPHLLNFIENNGVMLSKQYTPLIAHTATDILTSITGLYGDRMGVPVSNSFRYFNPDGTSNLG